MEHISEWGTPYASKDSTVRSWSSEDFFARVQTYKISTWLDKPLSLSPLECARYGWVNCGKDLLECTYCKARIMFRPHPDLEKSTVNNLAKEFIEKIKKQAHKEKCAWVDSPSLPFGEISSDPQALISSYQSRIDQLRENLHKFPAISHSFIIDLTEKLQIDGIALLRRANVTELTNKNVVSCILSLCGWIWKQSTPSTTPSSPSPSHSHSPFSSPPRTPQTPNSPSLSSSSSSSHNNEFIYCSFCQRDIGLWNHIYHEDFNGIDDDYTPFFKGHQLAHKRAVRIDYQSFGKSWDKATNTIVQNSGWGWGSSIAKIGQQENFKTIQKEPFHPVQAHRWFCPYLLTREGVAGWERVATILQDTSSTPSMENQALDVINILHELTSPATKRRRVDSS